MTKLGNFEIPAFSSALPITVETEPLENGLRLTYRADASLPMTGELHLPSISVEANDTLVIPHYEGYAFRADDPREIMPRRMAMLGGPI